MRYDERATAGADHWFLHEQAHAQQPGQTCLQVRVAAHRLEDIRGRRVAAHAHRLDYRPVGRRQPIEPFEHQLGDVGGDVLACTRPEDPRSAAAEQLSGIDEGRDERSDEQRNALRPGTEQAEQRRRWRAPEKASGQCGDAARIQRTHRQLHEPLGAAKGGQHGAQALASLALPVSQSDQAGEPGHAAAQVEQQVERARIRPVQVVDQKPPPAASPRRAAPDGRPPRTAASAPDPDRPPSSPAAAGAR